MKRMAMKDWKQYSKDQDHLQWGTKNTHPQTFIHVYKQDYVYKKDIEWVVDVNKSGDTFLEKKFESKSQALSFAKKYMRTH